MGDFERLSKQFEDERTRHGQDFSKEIERHKKIRFKKPINPQEKEKIDIPKKTENPCEKGDSDKSDSE